MIKKKLEIIFLTIKTNQQKIDSIWQCVQRHFDHKDHVLVLAPSDHAKQYLDDLLWKYPENSFLPHLATNKQSNEKIVITTLAQNLNNAKILVNLCSDICPITEQFEIVYELYDETSSEKLEQSKRRQRTYAQKNQEVRVISNQNYG